MKLLVLVFGLFVSLVAVDAGVSLNNPFYCYVTDWVRPQNQFHAVRTSYEAVRRSEVDPLVSSCTPSRFWYLGRHGGRNPETSLLHRMFAFADSPIQANIQRNSQLGRSTLCREDLDLLAGWTRNMNISVEHESLPTISGWHAMQNIARRYQQLYPTLLPNVYSANFYRFQHTTLRQAHGSIRAFADGLFGDGQWGSVAFEEALALDWLLRPHAFCPAFQPEVSGRRAHHEFAEGPEVEQMLLEINRRMGFTGANQLSFFDVWTMWEWCRFETASFFEVSGIPIGPPSPWCVPFTVVHNELLEYIADLDYYHMTGYGVGNREMIENFSCGVMQDLLLTILGLPVGGPVSRIFVAHQQIIHFLLVNLGAIRDNNPLHQFNFAQQTFRQWRVGHITPNAGNLAVVIYNCPGGDHDVYFLLNERPLVIPGCEANGVCKSSFLLSRFQRFIGANCQTLFCPS